jgi:dethiobiotin synthetase
VLAAEREGRTIDFDDLLIRIEGYAAGADIVLLEGVGGLLAPITWEWCLVDIAQALDARAVLVASDRSGSVNHALLTLGALELASVPVTDVVITSPEVPDASTGTNDAAIARLGGIARIREAARTTDPDAAAEVMRPVAEALIASGVGAYATEPGPSSPPA